MLSRDNSRTYKKNNAKYRPNKLREVRQTGAILVSQVCRVALPLLSSVRLSSPLFFSLSLPPSLLSRVSFHFVHVRARFIPFILCLSWPCTAIVLADVYSFHSMNIFHSLFLSMFHFNVLNRTKNKKSAPSSC